MCEVAKVCEMYTVMCGNEKGHSPPRIHRQLCIMHPQIWLPLLSTILLVWMVVMWCSSWVPPNAFYQNFKDFSFESATDLKMDLRTNTPATYMCNVGYSSCDLLASVLPILPLFWRKVPTFLFRLYCLQKTFLKKSGRIGKKGRNAWLSHQLSYYFYSFPQNYYHKFLGRCSFNMNYYIS